MRQRDPRRQLARRRAARARVSIIKVPDQAQAPDGSIATKQVAEVTVPRAELERMWTPEYLERLARTYWRFLTRASLGLLRVLYTPHSREIVLLTRPLVLLRFFAPEYEVLPDGGAVTWRINRGLLVAPRGRGRGYLRIEVRRLEGDGSGDNGRVVVSSEVASFYPLIAGWGWFHRIGKVLYRFTQYRIHIVVTHAFLRSLANLDLAPSVVGAMAPEERSDQLGQLASPSAQGPPLS